jgi:putative transposase
MPVEEKKKYLENYRKQEKIIDIHAFVFMDNHFHFLIRQLIEKGIFTFISNFQNSFGKYYNKVNKRNGSVFQKPFKSKRISSDSDFLHVGRYIHLNPVTSFCMDIKELETYPYDSYKCYLEKGVSGFVNTKMTLDLVGSVGKYRKFVEDRVDYQRKLKQIKRLLFE